MPFNCVYHLKKLLLSENKAVIVKEITDIHTIKYSRSFTVHLIKLYLLHKMQKYSTMNTAIIAN